MRASLSIFEFCRETRSWSYYYNRERNLLPTRSDGRNVVARRGDISCSTRLWGFMALSCCNWHLPSLTIFENAVKFQVSGLIPFKNGHRYIVRRMGKVRFQKYGWKSVLSLTKIPSRIFILRNIQAIKKNGFLCANIVMKILKAHIWWF